MKAKILVIFYFLFMLVVNSSYAEEKVSMPSYSTSAPTFYTAAQQERDVEVFSENNLFGLKDKKGNIVAPAEFQKIIMTGRSGWIVQKKKKFGLMDSKGNYLVEPKYQFADRIMGRYIKLGNDKDYGIYNEYGEIILAPEYSSIDLLYGRMFLTKKDYRYGVTDFNGNVLIPNICDDIYMPTKNTMRIKYHGEWFELDNISLETLKLPDTIVNVEKNEELQFGDFLIETAILSEYSALTFSDFFLKMFASISPAHEETIDELIFAHGVDTVEILMNFSWLPKYPAKMAKKYFEYLKDPFNGPFADTRHKLKNKR